ncbi:MAG: 3-oxoacyl-[acyl-carrier-protein] reductase [Candidatus Paracaedibacteraceae bacterium]|nr:3-oxoacyl-[acyl-carrier-protein] reductase [Candidatus Paracaedibacteraceae bacterium]
MFRLDGKKVLITGATGGIGKAICHFLVKQGAFVVMSGTNAGKLETLQAELPKGQTGILPCNLEDVDSVNALFDMAEHNHEQIDILVNNAGITRDGLAMRMKDDDWESVLAVNLSAAFRLCRPAVKAMMKRRYGRIINISSVVGAMGNPGQANYVAAKAGLIGLTKSLATEVATRNVTVNAVAPGFIQTAMTDILTEQQKERILMGVPMGKMGQPEDIAAAIAFLASEEANYITGHTLHINGGLYMA